MLKNILLVIGIVALACDAWFMRNDYKKQNIAGIIYWGFWTILVMIALKK